MLLRNPNPLTSRIIIFFVIFVIWNSVGLVVGFPNAVYRHDTYYGNTGFCMVFFYSQKNRVDNFTCFTGCYINSKYSTERIVADYLWVWVTGIVMVILYSYMAFTMYHAGLGPAIGAIMAKKLLPYVPQISSLFQVLTCCTAFPSYTSSVSSQTASHAGCPSAITMSLTKPFWP